MFRDVFYKITFNCYFKNVLCDGKKLYMLHLFNTFL